MALKFRSLPALNRHLETRWNDGVAPKLSRISSGEFVVGMEVPADFVYDVGFAGSDVHAQQGWKRRALLAAVAIGLVLLASMLWPLTDTQPKWQSGKSATATPSASSCSLNLARLSGPEITVLGDITIGGVRQQTLEYECGGSTRRYQVRLLLGASGWEAKSATPVESRSRF